jgi:hypothetical protein
MPDKKSDLHHIGILRDEQNGATGKDKGYNHLKRHLLQPFQKFV